MKIAKRINTGAVLCVDEAGHDVVALGKGVGFCEVGEELPLARISRTFYDVDPAYLSMFEELPPEAIEMAAYVVSVAEGLLPYELNPNIAFILADHLAFMVKRARERIAVRLPLSYDVKHQYPVEYRIGLWTVKLLNEEQDLMLPPQEAIGVALAFINNAARSKDPARDEEEDRFDALLEETTRIVEQCLRVTVDRESVSFARFATHVQYLYERSIAQTAIETENEGMYEAMSAQYPEVSACVDRISDVFLAHTGYELSDEERLYLMLHVNRIAVKAAT